MRKRALSEASPQPAMSISRHRNASVPRLAEDPFVGGTTTLRCNKNISRLEALLLKTDGSRHQTERTRVASLRESFLGLFFPSQKGRKGKKTRVLKTRKLLGIC